MALSPSGDLNCWFYWSVLVLLEVSEMFISLGEAKLALGDSVLKVAIITANSETTNALCFTVKELYIYLLLFVDGIINISNSNVKIW